MNPKRDFSVLLVGRVLSASLAILTVRVTTHLLSPEQYGIFSILNVVQAFCGYFLINPMGMYINRNTHDWWDEGSLLARLVEYKRYLMIVGILGGIIAAIVLLGKPNYLVVAGAAAILLAVSAATWNATWVSLLNMVGFRGYSVVWGLVTNVSSLFVSVCLCECLGSRTAIVWYFGQICGLTVGAYGAWRVFQKIVPILSKEGNYHLFNRENLLAYCMPLAIGNGFMWLQLSGYRLFIDNYWGLQALGYLSVGFALAAQLSGVAETLAQQFLLPLFYRNIASANKQNQDTAFSDLLNIMVPIYIFLSGLAYFAVPLLLRVFVSNTYSGVGAYVRIGIGIEFCRVIANLLTNAAQVTRKTSSTILPYAIGSLTLICSTIYFGRTHSGIWWAVSCILASACIMMISMWAAMLKQVEIAPDYGRWIISLGATLGMLLISNYTWNPSSLLAAVMVLLFVGVVGVTILVTLLKGSGSLHRLFSLHANTNNGVT